MGTSAVSHIFFEAKERAERGAVPCAFCVFSEAAGDGVRQGRFSQHETLMRLTVKSVLYSRSISPCGSDGPMHASSLDLDL